MNVPEGSVVGLIAVQQLEGDGGLIQAPIYNLVPPKGMPAQLGFQIAGVPDLHRYEAALRRRLWGHGLCAQTSPRRSG